MKKGDVILSRKNSKDAPGKKGRIHGHSRRMEVQYGINDIPVFKRRVDLWKAP